MKSLTEVDSAVIERFARLKAKNKLAHAYLLVGPQDSGKSATAMALAQLVNCESGALKACGECVSCRKIISGNHPDVHWLGVDDTGSIKIEVIRFLLGRAHLKAYEGTVKVFIIRDIEQMTSEAANALLKTLEEPAANTLMILTTSVPEDNLDTIKSRCHIVKFFPSSINRITQLLTDEGMSSEEAHFLALFCEGCLGRVRRSVKQDIILQSQKVLDEMLFNRRNDDFLKELSGEPAQAAFALQLLLSFFRDVVLLKSGAPCGELLHQGRLEQVRTFAGRDIGELSSVIRQIIETKKLMNDKLNAKMSLSLLREYIWAN